MPVQPQRGFTLVELVITLLIAAILVTVGIPSYRYIIRDNRGTAIANEALTAINFARSEAIKRGISVSVRSSTGTTDWSQGYSVFVDINGDGTFTDDGDADTCETDATTKLPTEDCLLRVWDRHKGKVNTVTAGASSLTYNSAGSTTPFTINRIWPYGECEKDRQQEWTVTVTAVGRASVSKSNCT